MDAQDLYVSLGQLVATVPAELSSKTVTYISPSTHEWMGRAFALVQQTGLIADAQSISLSHSMLSKTAPAWSLANIMAVLYRALAVAELSAPASARGAFINAGNALDAMAAVGKVLGQAQKSVRIVDPYMDEKAVTDFAATSPANVSIELLADAAHVKPTLSPAVTRWKTQYPARPIEAKQTSARSLHDRLIIVDGAEAWTLTQSLNAFASRSPASILKVDPETAALKIAAYDAFWSAATVVP